MTSEQTITQNFDPHLSSLAGFDDASIRKTKFFTNVILDNKFPSFLFVPSPPVKPRPRPPKVRHMPTKEEIEAEKKLKRAKELMFSPFKIYEPPAGQPWGTVPQIAIMPWEVKKHLGDKDKMFFLFDKIKVASPKKGYKYIPIYYGPTGSAKLVDKKLVYIPYLVLVPEQQQEMDVPTLGVKVWNIELQRDHFVRIQHNFGGKKAKVDRSLATKIYSKKKPVPKKKKPQPTRWEFYDLHHKKVANETKKMFNFTEFEKAVAKEVNLLERHNFTKAQRMKKNQTIPMNGGYSEAIYVKPKTENELKIEKLTNLLNEVYEANSVNPKAPFITSTFPLLEVDPGRYPIDGVPVNKPLPNNTIILNVKLPMPPVKDSKYIPLFYGNGNFKTRKGLDVWIPNFVLVPSYFGLPMGADQELPLKIPSYVPRDPYWENYDLKLFDLSEISLTYDKILADKEVLKPPFTETGHYMRQKVFNLMVEGRTKKPRTMKDILKRNNKRIQDMLDQLGKPEARGTTIPKGAAMMKLTGRPHLDKDGKPIIKPVDG